MKFKCNSDGAKYFLVGLSSEPDINSYTRASVEFGFWCYNGNRYWVWESDEAGDYVTANPLFDSMDADTEELKIVVNQQTNQMEYYVANVLIYTSSKSISYPLGFHANLEYSDTLVKDIAWVYAEEPTTKDPTSVPTLEPSLTPTKNPTSAPTKEPTENSDSNAT